MKAVDEAKEIAELVVFLTNNRSKSHQMLSFY